MKRFKKKFEHKISDKVTYQGIVTSYYTNDDDVQEVTMDNVEDVWCYESDYGFIEFSMEQGADFFSVDLDWWDSMVMFENFSLELHNDVLQHLMDKMNAYAKSLKEGE